MSVEIFAVNISARLDLPVEDWLKFFTSERQEKILAYRFNADRNRTIWAELLARYAVSERFACAIEKVRVYRDSTGKPHIAGLPVEISLSHAGDWAVCSVGKSGVDVEVDSTGALEIAERFFLPCEFEKIISLPEDLQRRQFLIYWTLKESYFKLTGDENFLCVDCEKLLGGRAEIIGRNFFLRDGAVVGVCVAGRNFNGEKDGAFVSNSTWNLPGLAGSRRLQRAFSSDAERRN